MTHALEAHKTLSGEDVAAVIEGTHGPLVDGVGYLGTDFTASLEDYHRQAVQAHKVVHDARRRSRPSPNPSPPHASPAPERPRVTAPIRTFRAPHCGSGR